MLAIIFALIVAASAKECQKMCTMQYEPVCGTDGKTYGNDCQLTSQACTAKTSVRKAYAGPCSAQQNACPKICTMNYSPVCGSDGKTYGNECQLTSQACLAKKVVSKLYDGVCGSQIPKMCPMNFAPVCGSDGRTYRNKCQMTAEAKSNVKIAHEGECLKAECPKICTMQYDPVCGTDNVTYGNECQLTAQACQAKKAVAVAKAGVC